MASDSYIGNTGSEDSVDKTAEAQEDLYNRQIQHYII